MEQTDTARWDSTFEFPTLIDAARSLAPEIRRRSAEFEAARRLPADLARKIAERGLFRLWAPKIHGGFEMPPVDAMRVIEEVSQSDGSVGWCVMIAVVSSRRRERKKFLGANHSRSLAARSLPRAKRLRSREVTE